MFQLRLLEKSLLLYFLNLLLFCIFCKNSAAKEVRDSCFSKLSGCQSIFPSGYWQENLWQVDSPCLLQQFFNLNSSKSKKLKLKLKRKSARTNRRTNRRTNELKFIEPVSILFIGDSLDRNAVSYACKYFGTLPREYLESNLSSMKYQYCTISRMNLTIANFMSYGVFPPPYWKYAYLDMKSRFPEKVANETFSHINIDTKRFNMVNFGQDPTIVVVQSYLWDLAREWLVNGSQLKFIPQEEFFTQWLDGVKILLGVVKYRFPNAQIIWRTAPDPKPAMGRSGKLTRKMNRLVLEYLKSSNESVRIVDWSKILLDRNSPQKRPTTHPGQVASLAYVNVVLNIAQCISCK